jgi:CheY-like chemotaxis protein
VSRKHEPPFRLLLAEDNTDEVLLMRHAVSAAAPRALVNVVEDGVKAIDYLGNAARQDQLPSLILLDISLPKASGFEVLTWIRKHAAFARVPVVMLTGSGDPADVGRALSLGANSYLVKPGSGVAFMEMIQSLLVYWADFNLTPWGS